MPNYYTILREMRQLGVCTSLAKECLAARVGLRAIIPPKGTNLGTHADAPLDSIGPLVLHLIRCRLQAVEPGRLPVH